MTATLGAAEPRADLRLSAPSRASAPALAHGQSAGPSAAPSVAYPQPGVNTNDLRRQAADLIFAAELLDWSRGLQPRRNP